jgi:hypothetical protein
MLAAMLPEPARVQGEVVYLATYVDAISNASFPALLKIMSVHRDLRRRDEIERKVIGRHD